MVFRLKECRDWLTNLLNISLAAAYSQSNNVLNAILELYCVVGQLLVMWENKRAFAESCTRSSRR